LPNKPTFINILLFGVNDAGNIYTLYGDNWVQLPGALKHVTIGPAGVWGVNNNNNIYKLVGGSWQQTTGLLKQIDAGGDLFIAGVNMNDDIFSVSAPAALTVNQLPWVNIAGKLKYYSCGPLGCWGVNSADDIYFRTEVTPDHSEGSNWQHIPGKLSMIEVGTDGSVYGVNSAGQIYRRDGIAKTNPVGTTWTQVVNFICKAKHVSHDQGLLWVISDDGRIMKCQI
uniref:Fish-egg lectin n=1 Tax=Pelusios castaneus TaxID=367368 RepID=A0A8C8VFA4_9SAUR